MGNSGIAPITENADGPVLTVQARIISVARELFCRDGIHATGVDRILGAANASKMALYARFGSKEALLRVVLEEEGAEWRERLFAALDAAPGETAQDTAPLERLRAVVPALRGWFEGGHFYGCALMNAIAEHPKTETWLRDLAGAHHRAILDRLTALAAAGEIAEPALLARQILLLMDGTIAALMVSNDPTVLDVAARSLEAILRGARPIASPGRGRE